MAKSHMALSRKSIERLAAVALPGLVHFGAAPLRIEAGRKLKWIRLYMQGRTRLHLKQVSLEGVERTALSNATATMTSSIGRPNREGLLTGRGIRSRREIDPAWQIDFAEPTYVDRILVTNRLVTRGMRGYGLCAELNDGTGSEVFDNLDPSRLLARLTSIQATIEGYLDFVETAERSNSGSITSLIAAARESTNRMIGQIHAAMDGSLDPTSISDADRRRLMASILEINEKLTELTFSKALPRSAQILDWLIFRGRREPPDGANENDLRALAAVFCAHLLDRGRMSRRFVLESQTVIDTQAKAEFIEQLVNRWFVAAGGNPAMLPIMFRKHGMGGPRLHRNAHAFVASMKEVEQIFEGIGYDVAICYGTLLGAVRDGGFIPHDDDIDMAVVLKPVSGMSHLQELNALIGRLKEQKVKAGYAGKHQFLKVKAPVAGKATDVFPIVQQGDESVTMYMEGLRMRDVPRSIVLPLGEISFYGETFKAPAQPEAFLADRYGSDWRVPRRPIGSRWIDASAPVAAFDDDSDESDDNDDTDEADLESSAKPVRRG